MSTLYIRKKFGLNSRGAKKRIAQLHTENMLHMLNTYRGRRNKNGRPNTIDFSKHIGYSISSKVLDVFWDKYGKYSTT